MHNSSIVLTIAKLAAYSLIFASCGFAAAFAWKIGAQHSVILGAVTVLFAVALDCIKPLAIGAAFQAFAASNIVRAALLAILGVVAVLYSLSAEISLIATNRTDIVAERTNSTYFASQSMRKYEAARDEPKALPPSRLLEEIEAERVKTSNEAKLAKLTAESARAKRRIELQSVINSYLDNVQQTGAIKVSDPGSHALQLYLSALGVVASVDVIGQIMVLIPVLALEIGSALAIVLVQAVAPTNRPELRFNQPEQLFAAQNNSPAPKLLAYQRTTRSETEKKIINHLQGYNSNQRVTEHTLADQIGANRSTVHRALASLSAQGMIDVDARGRRGTVIKLRG